MMEVGSSRNFSFFIVSFLSSRSSFLSYLDPNTVAQKKLHVPWVEDKNSNMRMLHISHMDDLIANSMNILEPAPVDAHGNDREDG